MRANIDLYSVGESPEQLVESLNRLREEFREHNHDGTSSKRFETLFAQTASLQTMLIRKTSYGDSTAGIWMGFVDGTFKLKLGDGSQFMSWDGSALNVQGTITGTTFNGVTIAGSTITGTNVTGGTVKTSNNTTRVELNGTDNALYIYDSGEQRVVLSSGIIAFYTPLGLASGAIYGLGTNNIAIDTGSEGISLDETTLTPFSAAGLSLGDATFYWNDVSYKTLTDRGCIGWYDEGVELQDGRIVSDIEALQSIRPHPTKKTPRGAARMDYRTMPKHVYVKATYKGEILPRDENDDPYYIDEDGKKNMAEDGAETTALIAMMIGAIKELDNRVKQLEKK